MAKKVVNDDGQKLNLSSTLGRNYSELFRVVFRWKLTIKIIKKVSSLKHHGGNHHACHHRWRQNEILALTEMLTQNNATRVAFGLDQWAHQHQRLLVIDEEGLHGGTDEG